MEGFLHQHWEGIQKQYLDSTHSRRSPRRWMRMLVLKTWMVSWDMWDTRNGIVHQNQATRQEQITAALDMEIRDIHAFGRNHLFLPPAATTFFSTNLEDILAQTDYQKKIWTRLGNRYLDNDKRRMAKNREAARMREWLVPGSSKGRRRVRNRTYNRGTLAPRAPGGEGTREPRTEPDESQD